MFDEIVSKTIAPPPKKKNKTHQTSNSKMAANLKKPRWATIGGPMLDSNIYHVIMLFHLCNQNIELRKDGV